MKIVFAGRSVAHFSYYETTVQALCRSGHEVQMLFDRGWTKDYPDHAVRACQKNYPGLSMAWSIRRRDGWRRLLTVTRELRSFASYVTRKNQSEYYLKRWQNYLPPRLRRLMKHGLARAMVATSPARAILALCERVAAPDREIQAWLKKEAPDVLVASPVNMRFSEEVEYVKAARALKIPTVVPVLTWDNLTTKGLFHVNPDMTLVWNEVQKEEACAVNGVSPETVLATGSPFFDKWFGAEELEEERESFVARIGLPQKRPILLYLGSSANIAKDESWLVEEIHKCVKEHTDPNIRSLCILVRPHPANARVYERLGSDGLVVWPKEGSLPDSEETKIDFYNSVRHSSCAIGINTSGMIDITIRDLPCITVLTDRYRKTQQNAVHFQNLLEAQVLEVARDAKEAVELAGKILRGGDSRRGFRQKFVQQFVRPRGMDRQAGEVAALAIELAGRGNTPLETDQALSGAAIPNESLG